MQYVKKYFTEGLIQFTILLSLVGVRVDVDSYLNGYFSPLIEIDGGPDSAFIQTPFRHWYRDTAAGHGLHPKCPELDRYFASRRLLDEVRTLGGPARFHTRLSAWLVQRVPARDGAPTEHGETDSGQESEQQPQPGQEQPPTDLSHSEEEVVKEEEEEISLDSLNQLPHSSTLEQEVLFGSSTTPLAGLELHPRWQDFLSDFDDFSSLGTHNLSSLDVDLSDPISYNASLQDAIITSGGDHRPDPPRAQATPRQRASLFRLESTNSSHSDTSPAAAGPLVLPPFSLSGNSSHNGTSHSQVGGYLDEAVFEQINLLGLEGLGSIEPQLLNRMEDNMDAPWLEGFDSDSGLSLESSSRSPASASTSSSSDSFCEDEGGATGYSSEVESLSNKGGACGSAFCNWQPVDLTDSIWHDHSYSVQLPENHRPDHWTPSLKAVKQEVMSEDDAEPEEQSRDGRRLQALGLPFTAPQIVNMPVEDFLELLEGRGLSMSEVTLLRDVRRRGKNKLAAQNCRKRKMDAIMGLQQEVEALTARRDTLLRERAKMTKTLSATAECFETLSQDMLRCLRDEHGQPLSPEHYTLHCGTNGRVVVRPRTQPSRTTTTGDKSVKRKKDKKP